MAHKITQNSVEKAVKVLIEGGELEEGYKPNATNAKKIAKLLFGLDKDGKQVQPDKASIALVLEYIKPEEDENELAEEANASDADMGKVKTKYKTKYAKESPTKTGCGDEFDLAFQTYCSGKDGKKLEGEDLLGKIKAVGNANGIDVMARWGGLLDRTGKINVGMIRMNLANVLRGRVRKGEKVTVGKQVWAADPEKAKAAKAKADKAKEKLKALKDKPKKDAKAKAKKAPKTPKAAPPEAVVEEGPQEGAAAE